MRLTHLGLKENGGGGRKDVPFINPKHIIIRKGFNHRDIEREEVQQHIAYIANSIRTQGFLPDQALSVEFVNGKVYLVDGECRLRASLSLMDEFPDLRIPVIQVTGDEANIIANSLTANSSLPPTTLEFGNAASRLSKLGWDDDRIAALCPPHIKSPKRYVKDAVELHNAPLAVKAAVRDGIEGVKVSTAAAVSAVRKDREQAADNLREKALEAKSSGKSEVVREKAQSSLLMVGDHLAALVLADADIQRILETARSWQKQRGI